MRTARAASYRRPGHVRYSQGVDLAGSLAPEIQFVQVFFSRRRCRSGETENSKHLIKFLASPLASEAIRKSGMEPLATSH
jgi:hypothetical protein